MDKQLFQLSQPEFVSYIRAAEAGQMYETVNGSLPWVRWPDGQWCIEVNLYLQWLYARGYSIKGRGGTLATYAAYITPLIRYCANNTKGSARRKFIELLDAEFTLAIRGLGSEKVLRKGTLVSARSPTYICKIGAVWLDFLVFVGEEYYGDLHFVGRDKRIKGFKKEYEKKVRNGRNVINTKWWHASFPEPEPDNKRLPMNDGQLERLRHAAERLKSDDFLRNRRLVMLELFESLGLRRMEAVLLRVSDVRRALRERKKARVDGHVGFIPMLRFRTVKKKGGKFGVREVPIDDITLNFIETFGRLRKRHLAQLEIEDDVENGLLLINSGTGKGLVPNTITLEFSILAKAAGIKEQCCPHMMRHRYITKAFVRLILAHELELQDDFRKALIDSSAFKQKVMEITGHISEESLNIYINLAFDEVAELGKTMTRVQAQSYIDALSAAKNRYRADIARGKSVEEAAAQLLDDVDAAIAGAGRYADS